MNTADALRKRSSTRMYTGEPLSDEEVSALIEAGLTAPTATDRREIHFSVVRSDNPLISEIEDERQRILSAANIPPMRSGNFCYDAPVLIVLSAEKTFKWSPIDAGIAVENIALAAEDLGLGSVIIGCIHDAMCGDMSDYFAKKLKFPENYVFQIAIAAGHKADEKAPHTYDADAQVSYI